MRILNKKDIFKVLFNRFLCFVILISLISFFQACEKNAVSPKILFGPDLVAMSLPDTIWLGKDSEFRVSAEVDYYRSAAEIPAIEIQLTKKDGSSSHIYLLYDNGESGDLIAKDGIYSQKYSSRGFVSSPGQYDVLFRIQGAASQDKGVMKDSLICLDGMGNSPPVLSHLVIPEFISLDSPPRLNLIAIDVEDPEGQEDITQVEGKVYFPYSPVSNLNIIMRHLDRAVDTTFGPNTYIFLFHSRDVARQGIGDYNILFSATDRGGARSNELVCSLHFVSSIPNRPPVLSDLNAPDSLVAKGDTLKLSIRALDPDGQEDILRVWFDSYLPDGKPAKGNPFIMYDDGGELRTENIKSGDLVKGDGIYSLVIQGPVPGQKGDFHFVFQAEDKKNVKSNVVEHVIHVK